MTPEDNLLNSIHSLNECDKSLQNAKRSIASLNMQFLSAGEDRIIEDISALLDEANSEIGTLKAMIDTIGRRFGAEKLNFIQR